MHAIPSPLLPPCAGLPGALGLVGQGGNAAAQQVRLRLRGQHRQSAARVVAVGVGEQHAVQAHAQRLEQGNNALAARIAAGPAWPGIDQQGVLGGLQQEAAALANVQGEQGKLPRLWARGLPQQQGQHQTQPQPAHAPRPTH